MADVKVTALDARKPNTASTAVTASTFAASDNVYLPVTNKHVTVVVTPSAAGNIVFKAGDSFQATNDITIAAAASKDFAITLDTASFAITTGTNKGCICMTPAVAGTVRVIAGL